MAIRIQKGGSTEIKMEKFSVGLGWQVREDASAKYDFDLDVSAFMVDASGKIPTDDYLVFYNSQKRLCADETGRLLSPVKIVPSTYWRSNKDMRAQSRPVDPEMSVIGSIDNEEGGVETIDMELSKVRSDIEKIIICVSIYDAKNRRQNFGQVENAYVRIYSEGHDALGQEEIIYDLSEDFSTCASVEFVQLYRHNGTWKIKALGVGHHGEFDELVTKFTIMAIELKKCGDTHRIDLTKRTGFNLNGEITINLDWSDGKSGIFGMFKNAIDLDLGCFYEMRDGSKMLIDGFQFSRGRGGNRDQQTRQGCYTKPPYIWHYGNVRSGGPGKTIIVNPARVNDIKRIIVYTFIYESVARWAETDAVVKVTVPGVETVEVKIGQQNSDKKFCAIAQLDFNGDNSITVKKLVSFHNGHSDCDKAYGWGFNYSPGSKD